MCEIPYFWATPAPSLSPPAHFCLSQTSVCYSFHFLLRVNRGLHLGPTCQLPHALFKLIFSFQDPFICSSLIPLRHWPRVPVVLFCCSHHIQVLIFGINLKRFAFICGELFHKWNLEAFRPLILQVNQNVLCVFLVFLTMFGQTWPE